MSGDMSAALAALETVLQAAPLNLRRMVYPAGAQGGGLAAEISTGLETETPRGHAYDLEIAPGSSEPLTNLQFNQMVRVDVYVAAPITETEHRLDQVRALSDLAERVRSRVLTASGLDAKAEGLHEIRRNVKRALWIVIVPFSLRYEEDATAD